MVNSAISAKRKMHGQFQIVDRENTNSVNLAEKTSILQDLLKKHHSANSVPKKCFQVEQNVVFSEEEKMPFRRCM